jgi:hypothetical protein
VAKRPSVERVRAELAEIMEHCCRTGDHAPFYRLLKDYGIEAGTERYVSAVGALKDFDRLLRSQ